MHGGVKGVTKGVTNTKPKKKKFISKESTKFKSQGELAALQSDQNEEAKNNKHCVERLIQAYCEYTNPMYRKAILGTLKSLTSNYVAR